MHEVLKLCISTIDYFIIIDNAKFNDRIKVILSEFIISSDLNFFIKAIGHFEHLSLRKLQKKLLRFACKSLDHI